MGSKAMIMTLARLFVALSIIFLACTPMSATEAAFIVNDLIIDPAAPEPGTTVKVGVMVTNTGRKSGIYKALLNIIETQTNSEIFRAEDVPLAGGASRKVTFHITAQEGTYTVIIGNLTGILEVPAS